MFGIRTAIRTYAWLAARLHAPAIINDGMSSRWHHGRLEQGVFRCHFIDTVQKGDKHSVIYEKYLSRTTEGVTYGYAACDQLGLEVRASGRRSGYSLRSPRSDEFSLTKFSRRLQVKLTLATAPSGKI